MYLCEPLRKDEYNVCHQHAHMYTAVTVSFVQIYAKLTKSVKCSEKALCVPSMSILVLFFTKKANSFSILIIVDTLTKHVQAITLN